MKNQTKINSQGTILTEELKRAQATIRLVLAIFVIFILITACIKFIFKIPLPLFIFVLFFIWMLIYLFYYYYVTRRRKNGTNLRTLDFVRSIIDIFLITVAIHFLAGVEWIGVIFYFSVLSWASATLPKNKVFAVSFMAVFFYSALALSEYFGFLPHRTSFGPSTGLYQNLVYILAQVLVLAVIFLFVSQNYSILANSLRKKQGELIEAHTKIEEAKAVLEIKVEARTRELRALTLGLEEEVKRRTAEVQGRMEELERFHRLVVGRELKMVELKKEIKKLKGLLKRKSQ